MILVVCRIWKSQNNKTESTNKQIKKTRKYNGGSRDLKVDEMWNCCLQSMKFQLNHIQNFWRLMYDMIIVVSKAVLCTWDLLRK